MLQLFQHLHNSLRYCFQYILLVIGMSFFLQNRLLALMLCSVCRMTGSWEQSKNLGYFCVYLYKSHFVGHSLPQNHVSLIPSCTHELDPFPHIAGFLHTGMVFSFHTSLTMLSFLPPLLFLLNILSHRTN